LSKDQQFARLADKINSAYANKEAQVQHTQEMVEGLSQPHPELAQGLSEAMQKKLEYLYTILPKNPNQPRPFMHDSEWHPTPAQLNEFQKQLAVANDPFHALEELKAGTLSASQVATLAVINPDILQKMRSELIRVSMDKHAKLDYQQRLTMGIMLGEKIDEGLFAIPNLSPAGNGAPQQGAGKKGGAKKASLQANKLPDYRTSFQKSISNSGSKG